MIRSTWQAVAAILLAACVITGCRKDNPTMPEEKKVVSFVLEGAGVPGEQVLCATFSRFHTDPDAGCWLVLYNLDDIQSISGILWGSTDTSGAHFGWHQWYLKDDGSFAPALCYPTFNAEFTIDSHDYTLTGECSEAPHPNQNSGALVATGTWDRSDGMSGTFAYYDGSYYSR